MTLKQQNKHLLEELQKAKDKIVNLQTDLLEEQGKRFTLVKTRDDNKELVLSKNKIILNTTSELREAKDKVIALQYGIQQQIKAHDKLQKAKGSASDLQKAKDKIVNLQTDIKQEQSKRFNLDTALKEAKDKIVNLQTALVQVKIFKPTDNRLTRKEGAKRWQQ